MKTLEEELKSLIRDIPDFPKKGILFKDITPLLANPNYSKKAIENMGQLAKELSVSAIVCVESRGYWLGAALAFHLNLPMIPIRKAGKLPYDTFSQSYELEYGNSVIEIHSDALKESDNVLIHDDVLATGGTASAAIDLVRKTGAEVKGFSFLIELTFLEGRALLEDKKVKVDSLIRY